MVGDRGMITQTQIASCGRWTVSTGLPLCVPKPIRKLINDGVLQMGLFDERNLFEVTHPDFPNERLVACRNPELAERRRHKRRASARSDLQGAWRKFVGWSSGAVCRARRTSVLQ